MAYPSTAPSAAVVTSESFTPYINLIPLVLEGFLYGVYSGVFAIYLRYQISKQDANNFKTQKILRYSICALYIASTFLFLCDIGSIVYSKSPVPLPPQPNLWFPIIIWQTTLFGCCDCIAQFILIYRCWIVWGRRNIYIVIFPSILALAYLGIWVATKGSTSVGVAMTLQRTWGTLYDPYPMTLTALTMSLTVNASMTVLMIFRIFKVFREVRATSDDKNLGATGGSKLRHIIWVLIESAMALFSIQLARLVVSILNGDPQDSAFPEGLADVAYQALLFIAVIHQMLNGIIPTIILVRISMGLSFHDEKSMEEAAIGSLRFASDHQSSVPEGSIGIVSQDTIRDGRDDIEVQQSNDIDVVER